MTTNGFYTVGNFGTTDALPAGYRSIHAVFGNRYVHVLDWASGDRVKVDFRIWKMLSPTRDEVAPRKRIIRRGAGFNLADTKIARATYAAALGDARERLAD